MSKSTFITVIISASVFTLIVADFYPSIPWYVQFGPIILTIMIIFIGAHFEKKKGEPEESASADEMKEGRKQWLYGMSLVWAAIIAMNVLVGEPGSNAFNIREPQFWIFVVAIPILSQFNFKKSSDAT